jgi:endoglucanase
MADIELLKELTLAPGVSGYEHPVANLMKNFVKKADEVKHDNLGSIAFYLEGKSDCPRVLVIAHMDEIGFLVGGITKEGFIKLQPVGGWSSQTLLSSQLKVLANNGKSYIGVIGSIPPHYKSESKKEDIVKVEEMVLDVGASSSEEVEEYGIMLGDPIVPEVNFLTMEKSRKIISKAWDDRVGIGVVIETLNYFTEETHPNLLIGAGSVQEEVGMRGAHTVADFVKPDIAFVIEGAPADDLPGMVNEPQTRVGGGAHIRLWDPSMIAHTKLKEFVLETARQSGIQFQCAVRRRGGTDGHAIHLSRSGVPTIVLGVPVRYAHSHRGVISLDDYDEVLKLLQNLIISLDKKVYEKIVAMAQ